MYTRRLLLKQMALALGAPAAGASQDGPTFSSEVRVINVLATVRTKSGEIVQDLTKDDFVLTEAGKPQTIKYFSRETNLPLVLGLLVDTSGSQRMVLGEEQKASYRFLDQVLREDLDRAFVVHFDYRPEVLQNMTASKAKLAKSLERLTLPFSYRGGGGTTLYDAVTLCSNLITKKESGRKAFVLLTDGEDHGSRFTIESAVEAAQRADTLLYSILFSDESFGGGRGFGPDGKDVLKKMSRETGGGYFEVSGKHPLDAVYRQLQEELRSQYSLGYTPADGARGFRAIRVGIKAGAARKGLVVQARSGYYAD
jgi:VWFA-related protein